MNAIKKEKITPAMYDQLEKDEHLKYELIDGIICMSPSPSMAVSYTHLTLPTMAVV